LLDSLLQEVKWLRRMKEREVTMTKKQMN